MAQIKGLSKTPPLPSQKKKRKSYL